MVNCSCEDHHGALLITFDDGRTLLLQSDYDQAAFAVRCGVLACPAGWNGLPSALPGFDDCDLSDVTSCPDEYQGLAEHDDKGV